jgi:glycosyltransferase involved in cell wall biosynthesis
LVSVKVKKTSIGTLQVGFDISGLDPHFKEHAQRGIGRYVRELKNHFDKVAPQRLEAPAQVGYFAHTDFKAGKLLNRLIECAPLGRETLRQQIVYPLRLRAGLELGFDVLHFPAHMDAPSWSPMPYLITVLDLIPVVCRDLYQTAETTWRFSLARWLELRAIRNAKKVLVISENTGHDVHKILGVPWERITVTPLGVSENFFADISPQQVEELSQRLGLDQTRPSLLYVGGIDQRKNWGYMFEVLARLRERCLATDKPVPMLIIAGRIDRDKQYIRFQAEIDRLKIRDLVKEVGFVSDYDLPILYRTCSVFFFPSLYEGFGLPPLEALAVGMPVVSSNTSAMPEVLGTCALYANPLKAEEGVEALFKILFEIPDNEEQRLRRRAQAIQFAWSKTGERTLAAYEDYARELAGKSSRLVVPRQLRDTAL